MDPEVINFFEDSIAKTKFLVDEDLSHLRGKKQVKKSANGISTSLIFIGASIGTMIIFKRFSIFNISLAAGAFMAAMSFNLGSSFLKKYKTKRMKNNLETLLGSFYKFQKRFENVLDYLEFQKNNIERGSVTDPIESMYSLLCRTTTKVVGHMVDLLSLIHKDHMNLKDFEIIPPDMGVLDTLKYIEGQFILLRSHLLISIYMKLEEPDNQKFLEEILLSNLMDFARCLEEGTEELGAELVSQNTIEAPIFPDLSRFYGFLQENYVFPGRTLHKNVFCVVSNSIQIVDYIKEILAKAEKIESKEGVFEVEDDLDKLESALKGTYESVSILKNTWGKIRKKVERPIVIIDNSTPEEEKLDQNAEHEEIEPQNDQPENEQCGPCEEFCAVANDPASPENGIDVKPMPIISERKDAMFPRKLITELKRCDLFKTRQIKFKTDSPSTSAIPERFSMGSNIEESPSSSAITQACPLDSNIEESSPTSTVPEASSSGTNIKDEEELLPQGRSTLQVSLLETIEMMRISTTEESFE